MIILMQKKINEGEGSRTSWKELVNELSTSTGKLFKVNMLSPKRDTILAATFKEVTIIPGIMGRITFSNDNSVYLYIDYTEARSRERDMTFVITGTGDKCYKVKTDYVTYSIYVK